MSIPLTSYKVLPSCVNFWRWRAFVWRGAGGVLPETTGIKGDVLILNSILGQSCEVLEV